jgi:hypothetical protein
LINPGYLFGICMIQTNAGTQLFSQYRSKSIQLESVVSLVASLRVPSFSEHGAIS